MKQTSKITYALLNKGEMTVKELEKETGMSAVRIRPFLYFLKQRDRITIRKEKVSLKDGKCSTHYSLNKKNMGVTLVGLRYDGIQV